MKWLSGKSTVRALVAAMLGACAAYPASAETPITFNKHIRPILSDNCFKCHGADENTRKAGLRFDERDSALQAAKSGAIAIVPGKPDESELIQRIFTADENDLMPPPSTKKTLTTRQKELLRQWIRDGAQYEAHWAFVAPSQPEPPAVKQPERVKNPIDQFVLARLEKEGLAPSPSADRYTLIRRVHLDLTGLPPTPAEVEAFVNDSSPNAYENLVDRLLASKHYGERWARRWLDLARYADTNGYEKDRPRSIWPYRDWVINALNADMPFDQFTIEQIAGDMLPHATLDQIIATGFHRNTMINEEGGIDPLEFRYYAMVDRVHVTATAWLGLTMSCAQCHTHKYDPIQQTEYFQFMALLNNADEPAIPVPNPEIAERRKALQERIEKLEAGLVDKFPAETKLDWAQPEKGEFASQHGAEAEFLSDGSFRVGGNNPERDTYTLKLETALPRITHIRVEAIPDEQVVQGGPGRTPHGNFVLSEIEIEVEPREGEGSPKKVKFSRAEADFSQDKFPVANAIDGKTDTGWAVGTQANNRVHRHAIFTLAEPVTFPTGANITARLVQNFGGQHTLGRFRLSFGAELPDPRPLAERQREHRDRHFAQWLETELPNVVEWRRLRPAEAKSESPVLTIEADDAVFATGDFTKEDTYTLKFRKLPPGVTAIRLEALPDERLPRNGPGIVHYEGPEGDFFLSNLKVSADGQPIRVKSASESFASGNHNAAKAIDDDLQSGWSINGGQGRAHNAVFQLAEPLAQPGELQIELTFERYYASALGKFRIWVTMEENPVASPLGEEAYHALFKYRGEGGLQKLAESTEAAADRDVLLRHFAKVTPLLAGERRAIDELRRQMPSFPTTLVMRERAPEHTRRTHRYHRGEFLEPKEEVTPGVPAFLPRLPADAPANRLTLAQWLVSPENPLTGRVVMNRHWEAFFGQGFVRTVEDFGFQGELPSHPDLMDWLAMEFMRQGWSQKKMHKLIVTSATYQQSSRVTPELLARDPDNVLLARGPRFRLESELVRDLALVVSGLFSDKVGGPSVYPPQPSGITTEGAYGALEWKTAYGSDRYRRGLYTFAKRTTPYAMTLTFDGPSGEACLPRRDRSNTPLQALTLLNDEVFVETARALGKWAAEQHGEPEAILEQVFRRCLTRPPTDQERSKLAQFYQRQFERFAQDELKAAEIAGEGNADLLNKQAAWTTVVRVLLNLHETITRS
jgi:mono/diheme cytochrome c family protein